MVAGRSRRCVLGTCTLVLVAGCLSDNPTDEEADADRTDWPAHDGTEPIAVPAAYRCDGVCGMDPATYPEWHAQIAHDDGTGAFFCSSGCLITYLAVPDHAEARDAGVAAVWVRDTSTVEWIDGTTAHWVLETDTDEQQPGEPMELNPRSFGKESEAVRYVAERSHLDDTSIVDFPALDRAVARQYRSSRIPPA